MINKLKIITSREMLLFLEAKDKYILVMEDEDGILDLLKIYLSKYKALKVEVFSQFKEGLFFLAEYFKKVELVIVDGIGPGDPRISQKIYLLCKDKEIPVIYSTGSSRPKFVDEEDYLGKPFKSKDLISLIKTKNIEV